MMTKSASAMIFAVPLILALTASPVAAEVNRPKPENAFNETDRDKDNRIDTEEFRARMVETFYFADANLDGVLVAAEITTVGRVVFRTADENNDGKLTLTEFLVVQIKYFEALDQNEDGELDAAEANAATNRP